MGTDRVKATTDLGFLVRPPTTDDAEAVTAVVRACELDHWGKAEYTVEELRDEWRHRPDFRLATDAWVVDLAGQVVAYAETWAVRPVRLGGYGRVHPAFRGRGIGANLFRLIERRARELEPEAPEGLRVVVDGGTAIHDQMARSLFEAHGYRTVRHFWRMIIDLTESPAPPTWPEGITVRPIVPGADDFLVFTTHQESFQDHWGFYPAVFESWRQARMSGAHFDPSLWFLAMTGEEAVGIVLCGQTAEASWVNNLGVRRPWRKRGIGEALLRHAFGEFYRRGRRHVALGVDAQNPTGAVALYERAGMRVAQEYVDFEKELRSGAEYVSAL